MIKILNWLLSLTSLKPYPIYLGSGLWVQLFLSFPLKVKFLVTLQSNMPLLTTSFWVFTFYLKTSFLYIGVSSNFLNTCPNLIEWHPFILSSIGSPCIFSLIYSFLMLSILVSPHILLASLSWLHMIHLLVVSLLPKFQIPYKNAVHYYLMRMPVQSKWHSMFT